MRKILLYILITGILAGGFSFSKVEAQGTVPTIPNTPPLGWCSFINPTNNFRTVLSESGKERCETSVAQGGRGGTWYATDPQLNSGVVSDTDNQTGIEKLIGKACGLNPISQGCILKLLYFLFYTIPAFILAFSAQFFNALVAISLSTELFIDSAFISEGWAVVRDISNIFFILILLYIAVEMILGLGGHGAKKMIAQVIVMAILINFSMFFTKVLIDTSNIIALVFYNKMNVETTVGGQPRHYQKISSNPDEKDISGGLVKAFDPTQLLSEEFFENAKRTTTSLGVVEVDDVPFGILLGVIIVAGSIMGIAAYAFFVSGMAFLSRFVELWILIVFSPFAFMSSAMPKLAGIGYVGWKEWSSRLFSVAFMAPIFMFFIYLIFKLVNENMFADFVTTGDNQGMMVKLMLVVIPAAVIIILLLRATAYAKKASGKAGEMVSGAIKAAGTLAVGGAALGVAFAGRQAIGRGAAAASRTDGAKKYGEARFKFNEDYEHWRQGGKKGAKPQWGDAKYQQGLPSGLIATIGGRINASQLKTADVSHARHEIEEIKKKAGVEGISDSHLSGVQQDSLTKTYVKTNRGEIESQIRRGYDAKGKEIIDPRTGKKVESESEFKAARRPSLVADVIKKDDPGDVKVDPKTGEKSLTDQGQRKVEDKLNTDFNLNLKVIAEVVGKERFDHLKHESKEKVTVTDRIASRSTGGTYDVRNLANLKTDKNDGLGAKTTVGLIAAVAAGIRLGLRKGIDVEPGTPKGDVLKDLGNTLSEAVKKVKINIDLSGGGGGHGGGHDDHGGGDHGHGGGGHH